MNASKPPATSLPTRHSERSEEPLTSVFLNRAARESGPGVSSTRLRKGRDQRFFASLRMTAGKIAAVAAILALASASMWANAIKPDMTRPEAPEALPPGAQIVGLDVQPA